MVESINCKKTNNIVTITAGLIDPVVCLSLKPASAALKLAFKCISKNKVTIHRRIAVILPPQLKLKSGMILFTGISSLPVKTARK